MIVHSHAKDILEQEKYRKDIEIELGKRDDEDTDIKSEIIVVRILIGTVFGI